MAARVVILGGGFGGLYAARALAQVPVEVVLVDRQNHHLFQPLLYQVAAGGLSPGDIASPIRAILRRQKNAQVILAEARAVDREGGRVVLDVGEIPFDYLIVASGMVNHYYGRDEWRPFAPGLKSLQEALSIRERILLAFEAAEREEDPARREAFLTFVVVGGGPTGVEMAGAIGEIARQALARCFRRIDPRRARVVLVEGGPRILPTFPEDLAEKALPALARLGVEVRAASVVEEVTEEGVRAGGRFIPARTVIWAAGVAASPITRSLGVSLDRLGRVPVKADLTLPGGGPAADRIFVIGDLALFTHQGGRPLPGVSPVAIQQARWTARNIARHLRGEPCLPFRYLDRGSMATIGRASAIADLHRFQLTGYLGWLAWLFVHLVNLIGFRSRLLVLVQWAWAYFTFQRSALLITAREQSIVQQGDRGATPPADARR